MVPNLLCVSKLLFFVSQFPPAYAVPVLEDRNSKMLCNIITCIWCHLWRKNCQQPSNLLVLYNKKKNHFLS